jgi:hypothetical protein
MGSDEAECDGLGIWHNRENRNVYMVLVGKPEGKKHLQDLDVEERVTLNCGEFLD